MAIFPSSSSPAINIDILPTFPQSVSGSGPITYTLSGLSGTIGWNPALLSLNPAPTPGNSQLVVYDKVNLISERVDLSVLQTGLSITASQISDGTATGRAVLTGDASAGRTALGLVIGTDVQAQDAELSAIASAGSSADQLFYYTGTGIGTLTAFSAFGRSLVDDADAAAARTTLGGTATGVAVFTAANAAAARTATGAAASTITISAGTGLTGGGDLSANRTLSLDSAADVRGLQTISIPGGAITPRTTNGAGTSTLETTTNRNMYRTVDFDTSTQEFAQFIVPMPKGWNEGTITYQVVWSHPSTTTNFGVVFGLSAVAISDGDAGDAAFGTVVTVTDTGGTTNAVYQTPVSGAVTIAGTPAENDLVMFQLQRNPADASDTLAVDARVVAVKIFFTINAATDA